MERVTFFIGCACVAVYSLWSFTQAAIREAQRSAPMEQSRSFAPPHKFN